MTQRQDETLQALLNKLLMVLILSCGGHCINFFLKCPFVFCVVLWSPRTLFVKSTLHERPLYWTLYCGDMFKIACLWIKGKITASISSSFCILEVQGVYRAGSAEHPNNPASNELDLLRRVLFYLK